MTLKNYILTMSFLTAICWAVFAWVFNTINPITTNWLGMLMFYITLGIALIGTSSILGLVYRFMFRRDEVIFNCVKNSFRQSFLFSFFIISLLLLQSVKLFTWINLGLLVIIFTVLEIFLSSRKKIEQ